MLPRRTPCVDVLVAGAADDQGLAAALCAVAGVAPKGFNPHPAHWPGATAFFSAIYALIRKNHPLSAYKFPLVQSLALNHLLTAANFRGKANFVARTSCVWPNR